TYAEIKAIASGNPTVIEKVKVDTEIRKLDQLRAVHQNQQYKISWQLRELPTRITQARRAVAEAKVDIDTRNANTQVEFSMTVGKSTFTGKGAREEAAKMLTEVVLTGKGDQTLESRGTFRGFSILSRGSRMRSLSDSDLPPIFLQGQGVYTAKLNAVNPIGT